MPTNLNPKSSTPTNLPYPLHRLNTPQTQLWFITGGRQIAAQLIRIYPGGVGVLSRSMDLFALVDPRGNILPQVQPFRRFEMWQIANQPRADECPCGDFIDLEQEAWKNRHHNGEHHPFCQFNRTAKAVFRASGQAAMERIRQGKPAQERPDEWLRTQAEIANR